MITWADQDPKLPPARTIDRDVEGPPRCCGVRHVAADCLVFWGDLSTQWLAVIREQFPQFRDQPDSDLYLCSGCRERLFREKLLTREDVARDLGMSDAQVAKAWLHDEEFWKRGPASAPAEATSQKWWAAYEALALTATSGELKGQLQELMRAQVTSSEEKPIL